MNDAVSNITQLISDLPDRIKLVAVTKTIPVEVIQKIYDAGFRVFGENKVQEIVSKAKMLPEDVEWHMIGHLQTNKVKYIVPFISMIHSVDSYKLLKTINNEAIKHNRVINCLLQMHIAKEESKFGFSFDELTMKLDSTDFNSLKYVNICGLMGIASFTDDMELVRVEFKKLAHYFFNIRNKYFKDDGNFRELSMGMTGDYKIAIEEGATIVRIGSLIFGERIKK